MFITLIHLACDVLSRFVALDEGDGLLNFKTVFKPKLPEREGANAFLLIAVVLCGGILQFLVPLPLHNSRRSMTDLSR